MVIAALCVLALATVTTPLSVTKHKRQIFREQVSPHAGGKIPDDAFRTDRLALNRLNKEGIAVPDGVLLEARHRESHHPSHRHDPAIAASIVKLVQHPDGRYAPPEGHYPFDNLIESTYIIRPPWGHAHSIIIPPHKTQEVPLTIPHRPLHAFGLGPGFHHGLGASPFTGTDDLLDFNNLDHFFNEDLPGTRIWDGFGPLFHQSPSRFLRQTTKKPTQQFLKGQMPRLTTIPNTAFECGAAKGKMVPDVETNCQVFHLCHTTGEKESFLCPQGMRFDPSSNQCMQWTRVPCGVQR